MKTLHGLLVVALALLGLVACSNQVGGGPPLADAGGELIDGGPATPDDMLTDASGTLTPDAAPRVDDAGQVVGPRRVSGSIAASESWSGEIEITGAATIPAGVIVTVAAGTNIRATAGLTVSGSLRAVGTAAGLVNFTSLGGSAVQWPGIVVESGGSLELTYATVEGATIAITCKTGAARCDMLHTELRLNGLSGRIGSAASFKYSTSRNSGGDGFNLVTGGNFVVEDSKLLDAGGDHIRVTEPATLRVEFSQLRGQHCALHFDRSLGLIIRNNEFTNNVYGFMLSGAPTGSIIANNNFLNHSSTWLQETGQNATVSATGNYLGGSTAQLRSPSGISLSMPSATARTDVGPRPAP